MHTRHLYCTNVCTCMRYVHTCMQIAHIEFCMHACTNESMCVRVAASARACIHACASVGTRIIFDRCVHMFLILRRRMSIRICTCLSIYVCVFGCMCASGMCFCVYAAVKVFMWVCLRVFVNVCMYVLSFVCKYACVYACMYVCVYIPSCI